MGQEQGKPSANGSPKGPAAGGSGEPTLEEQYAKEKAKMVHVTTANDVVAETPLYELEADRLLGQLQALQPKPPLLVSSVEGSVLLKKDKMLDELATSPRLKQHRLFHDSLLIFLAQFQTLALREGTVALKREEEIILRLQQFAHQSASLRYLAARSVQQVNALGVALREAQGLEADVESMGNALKDISALALEIDGALTEEEREDIRLAVLGKEGEAEQQATTEKQ